MRKKLALILTIMVAVALLTPIMALGTADFEEEAFTHRVRGDNRYETSEAVSQLSFAAVDYEGGADDDVPAADAPEVVVLATGANWPDALAAGPFAADFGTGNASLLLTEADALTGTTLDEIDRLDPTGDTDGNEVIIIGGPGAVSSGVERDLEDEDYEVSRNWGDDRYGTAADLDDEMGRPDNVYVCTGENFPDCLAASAAGAAATFDNIDIGDAGGDNTASILLVKKDEIPAPTMDALADSDRDLIVIVGGTGVVSTTVENDLEDYLTDNGDLARQAGADRYATAVELAEGNLDDGGWDFDPAGGGPVENFVFARGDDGGGGADALTGSLLAARDDIDQNAVNDDESVLDETATGDKAPAPLNIDDDWQLPKGDGPLLLVRPDGVPGSVDGLVGDCGDYTDGADDHCFGFILGGTGAVSRATERDLGELLSGEEWIHDTTRVTDVGWCFDGDTDCNPATEIVADSDADDDGLGPSEGDGLVDNAEAINLYVCIEGMGDDDEQYWPWAWDVEADLSDIAGATTAGGIDDVDAEEFERWVEPTTLDDCDAAGGTGDGEGFVWQLATNTEGDVDPGDSVESTSEDVDVDTDYLGQMDNDTIQDIPFD